MGRRIFLWRAESCRRYNSQKKTGSPAAAESAAGELHHLTLNRTQLTDSGLAHLKGLSGLQELGLAGTKVTDAGIADFGAALPKCKIHR